MSPPLQPRQNPFEDPLSSSSTTSSPPASSSAKPSSHLRQRSLTSRSDSLPRQQYQQQEVGHSMTLNMGGPGAFLMRQDDGASSRASSLYGDYDASSSNSHLPFAAAGSSPSLSGTESKYALSQDVGVYTNHVGGAGGRFAAEDDDELHNPGKKLPREGRARMIVETPGFRGRSWSGGRFLNVGALITIGGGLVILFIVFPIVTFWKANPLKEEESSTFVENGDGIIVRNAPPISNRALIDPDTPRSAHTKVGHDGKAMQLVFSDEFNVDGRQFYPGEDPFWQAQDFHYWQTGNLDWSDPDNVWTEGGSLQIQVTKEQLADSHGRGYLSGMLQSWNKFCFTGGRIEVAISLPGDTQVQGLWPAAWMLGNLGRAGYGATLEGTWPYAYDSCDIGTLANQTDPETGGPAVVTTEGDPYRDNSLSYLPGQRLSRCTCPGEDHPGPFKNGEFVGRGAPEIDIFEALVLPARNRGEVSMSAQWAPFDPNYEYNNATTDQAEFYENTFETFKNTYLGSAYQQVTSGLSLTNSSTYNSSTNFAMYGVEYTPSHWDGWGTGKISWHQEEEPQWIIHDTAMQANNRSLVDNRPVTGEPLSILLNNFMSENFGPVNLTHLVFPSTMRVDYVRVYQLPEHIDISCSTDDYPTASYIAAHPDAYNNANLTTWAQYKGEDFPKNRLIDTC